MGCIFGLLVGVVGLCTVSHDFRLGERFDTRLLLADSVDWDQWGFLYAGERCCRGWESINSVSVFQLKLSTSASWIS